MQYPITVAIFAWHFWGTFLDGSMMLKIT